MSLEKVSNPVTAPAVSAFSITPSDSDTFEATRGIFIGSAGNIKVLFSKDSTAVVLSGLTEGAFYPFSVVQVYSTDTTASNIVGIR